MHFLNLTDEVRALMVEEIDRDISTNTPYFSERFRQRFGGPYPELLRRAASANGANWLEQEIQRNGLMKSHESRRTKRGSIIAQVPHTAAQTFAEGEFNRFYLRALCRFTLDSGGAELEIYRAKQVSEPRSDSQTRIGKRIDAAALLADLRIHTSVETAMRLPAGPNSGLSAKLVPVQ